MKIPADARVRPLQNPEFVWPNIEEINKTQKQFLVTVKTLKRNEDNLAITDSGKVIIPEEAEDLRRRLCIIAHAGGNSGHLGYQATAQKLAQCFLLEEQRRRRESGMQLVPALPTNKRRSESAAASLDPSSWIEAE